MIESLRIRDLAVVEEAELELSPGLNVLTGETGAGKSLVLGALELLAGARASSDRVRAGSDAAVVEAVFRVEGRPELAAALGMTLSSLKERVKRYEGKQFMYLDRHRVPHEAREILAKRIRGVYGDPP